MTEDRSAGRRPCQRDWEVDAVVEGRLGASDEASFLAHRASCAACRERYAHDLSLRELARALPAYRPDEVRALRVRRNVLRAFATRGQPASRAWLLVAAALLALVAVGVRLSWPRAETSATKGLPAASAATPALAGVVTGDGRFTQAREGTLERVTLEDGTMTVHVRHQLEGERFVVGLPDGEIEVRGTTFVVTVEDRATRHVEVTEGRVALRLRDQSEQILAAGESWTRAEVASPAQARRLAVASAHEQRGDPSLDEYENATRLMRERDYEGAAKAYHAFASAHPDAAEVEDATFLEAVALSRAGHTSEAAERAREFLRRSPRSFHETEATAIAEAGAP